MLDDGAVSRFGTCGLPGGLRASLGTLHLCRAALASSTAATRGRSGWCGLTPQGLAPCTKTPSVAWRTNAPRSAAGAAPPLSSAWLGCADSVQRFCDLRTALNEFSGLILRWVTFFLMSAQASKVTQPLDLTPHRDVYYACLLQ
jgi:hypothetical protein